LERWLDLAAKVFGVVASVLGALIFVAAWVGNSDTSVAFVDADTNVIHAHLSNDGYKRSQVHGFRLKFPDLPIEPAPLERINADKKKVYVPRKSVDLKKKSIDIGGLDIDLIVPGLRAQCQPGLTEDSLGSMLRSGHAVLEVDIQEAKDPPAGPWHVRADTFPAERIRWIYARKIWFGGCQ